MNWKEILEKLNVKRAELAAIFDGAKTKIDGQDRYNLTPVQLEDVKARNAEIDDLAKQVEDLKSADSIFQANAQALREGQRSAGALPTGGKRNEQQPGTRTPQREVKSLGELFVESKQYTDRKSAKEINASFEDYDFLERKTLMETAAGWAPLEQRIPRVVDLAKRRPVIADLIPQTATEAGAISYMEETTFTNNAAAVLEGGEKPESALAFTERIATMREIATWLPVTEQQVEDVPVVRSVIDNRLMTMLLLAEEVQLVTGSGVAPNLEGFLVKAGVQSQAKGADPTPDAIYKAMTLVRYTGFAEPSAIVMHPNDWQDIRLLRTVDGIYIWGSPAEAGPERIWGLPAVITTAETENTALLGDFQLYSEIFRRRGATIAVSNSHSDFFIKNKLAIRADERLALAIYRAAAFAKVTGI